MVLLKLFLSFLKTGLLAIGGAYSFLPLLERELVEKYQWLTKAEFLDITGIFTILPGAISIKFATHTGYKMAGIPGVIVANLGNVLGPVGLVLGATTLYSRYKDLPAVESAFRAVQLAVFAMIISVAFKLTTISDLILFRSIAIVVVCVALFSFTKLHPALIIIAAAIAGVFLRT